MMKPFSTLSILFLAIAISSCSQSTNLAIEDIFGEYVLQEMDTTVFDADTLAELKAWIYKWGYDTISISKEQVVFGDQIVDDPVFNILKKEIREFKAGREASVRIPNVYKIYSCSETLNSFPKIKRKYDVVIDANIPSVWVIEPTDGNHIIILVNNVFVLYRKNTSRS